MAEQIQWTDVPGLDTQQATYQGFKEERPTFDANNTKVTTYQDMYNELMKPHLPDADTLKRERRRMGWRKWTSAIGSGLSAISNMITTNNGADNIAPTSTLSDSYAQRWNKLADERKKLAQQYSQGMMQMRMADNELARKQFQDQIDAWRDKRDQHNFEQQQAIAAGNEAYRRAENAQARADNRALQNQQQNNWQASHDESQRQNNRIYELQKQNAERAEEGKTFPLDITDGKNTLKAEIPTGSINTPTLINLAYGVLDQNELAELEKLAGKPQADGFGGMIYPGGIPDAETILSFLSRKARTNDKIIPALKKTFGIQTATVNWSE